MAIVLSGEDRQQLDALISSSLAQEYNQTPIFEAATTGKHVLVEACLRIGVDKDGKNRCGETPLIVAANRGHLSVVKTLIGAGADVNTKPLGRAWVTACEQGYTALHWASCHGHSDVAVALLCAGARKDTKSSDGSTPLIVAVKENRAAIVNLLLCVGADVTVCNKKSETALSAAAECGRHDIADALLRHGADVNAKGTRDEGNSLHALCAGDDWNEGRDLDYKKTMGVLLRWGANECATDDDGKTPADLLHDLGDVADPLRLMLSRAPADKAWYRRGWLIMLRSRVSLEKETPATQRHRGEGDGSTQLATVVHQLIDQQEEGVFRKVVSFL